MYSSQDSLPGAVFSFSVYDLVGYMVSGSLKSVGSVALGEQNQSAAWSQRTDLCLGSVTDRSMAVGHVFTSLWSSVF